MMEELEWNGGQQERMRRSVVELLGWLHKLGGDWVKVTYQGRSGRNCSMRAAMCMVRGGARPRCPHRYAAR